MAHVLRIPVYVFMYGMTVAVVCVVDNPKTLHTRDILYFKYSNNVIN